MSYEPLYKVFYKYEEKWQEILDARYASENTQHISISIAQINRKKSFSAFFINFKIIRYKTALKLNSKVMTILLKP